MTKLIFAYWIAIVWSQSHEPKQIHACSSQHLKFIHIMPIIQTENCDLKETSQLCCVQSNQGIIGQLHIKVGMNRKITKPVFYFSFILNHSTMLFFFFLTQSSA